MRGLVAAILPVLLVLVGMHQASAGAAPLYTLGDSSDKDAGNVQAIAFSPDRRVVATNSNGAIRFWDVASGRLIRTFTGDSSFVFSLAFSPDGRLLASGGGDGSVKLWDAASGALLYSLANRRVASVVAFSPDGHTLASTTDRNAFAFSPDGRTAVAAVRSSPSIIRLWDVATGKESGTLETTDYWSGIKIWDVASRRVISMLPEYTAGLVAYSPDGRTLALAGGPDPRRSDVGCKVILLDLSDKTQRTLNDTSGFCTSIAFSPDGQTLAAGYNPFPHSVKLWDVATGTALPPFVGHQNFVNVIAFSPGGQILASGSADYTVKLWPMARLTLLAGGASPALPSSVHLDPPPQVTQPQGDPLAGRPAAVQSNKVGNSDRAGQTQVFIPSGHASNMVEAVAFSPDGLWLASGGGDNEVILWDAARRQEVRRFEGSAGSVQAVAFSPDGRVVAAGGQDMIVRLWDARAGTEIRELQGHTGAIRSLAFAPDGLTLISGAATSWGQGYDRGKDNTARIWDLATGNEIRRLTERDYTGVPNREEQPGGGVMAVAISPDGRFIATGTDHDTVRLWDAARGDLVRELTAPFKGDGIAWSLAFSPDGSRLVSSQGSQVKIWEVSSGLQLCRLDGTTGEVRSVAFSPDGKNVAAAGQDGTLLLWDSASCKETGRLEGSSKTTLAMAFSPDGQKIAVGSLGGITIWQPNGSRVVQGAESLTVSNGLIVYSPDGTKLATADADNKIWVWDLLSGRMVNGLVGHTDRITAMAFSPDANGLVSSSWDGTVRIWNVTDNQELHRYAASGEKFGSVAFSHDGRTVAAGLADRLTPTEAYHINELNLDIQMAKLDDSRPAAQKAQAAKTEIASLSSRRNGLRFNIVLIDAQTGASTGVLEGHTFSIFSLAFAADDRSLFSLSGDQTVRVWDLMSRSAREQFRVDSYPWQFAFSADATSLVVGSIEYRVVTMWDMKSGRQTAVFDTRDPTEKLRQTGQPSYQKADSIAAMAISPNGKQLLLGTHDGDIQLWDTGTGQETLRARANSSWVNSVTFSPDGSRIAATGADGSIKMYDVTNNSLVGTLYGFRDGQWISILPDGRYAGSPLSGDDLRVLLNSDSSQTQPVEKFPTQFYKPNFVAGALAPGVASHESSLKSASDHPVPTNDKPRLYYLGIGVAHYPNLDPTWTLQFPVADVTDLGKALKEQEGKSFERVETKILTEHQVTRTQVFTEASAFLRQAREQDVVVLLVAGHGIDTDASGYYFLTYDADLRRRPQTTIPWTAFDSLLRDLRAPVIFLADTCKSADVTGGATWIAQSSIRAGQLAQSVTQGGVLVMTSSDSQSVSYENSEFHNGLMQSGHGAFVWAIIEALRGAAAEKSGVVTVADMWAYVHKRVPLLTEPLAAQAKPPQPAQQPSMVRSEAAASLMSLAIAR